MIDEYFKSFLNEFGPQIERREAPLSSIERYQGRLPKQLLQYWADFGWSGYAEGLFWMVNPQEYDGLLAEWLSGSRFDGKDTFHVIAVGAFGDLYIWGERFGYSFAIVSAESYVVPRNKFDDPPRDLDCEVRYFFASKQRWGEDLYELFADARHRLGELKSGEIYGFKLALALGGNVDIQNVVKVNTIEHLTFLAQLDELKVLRLPE
jgi:hypothetical protein